MTVIRKLAVAAATAAAAAGVLLAAPASPAQAATFFNHLIPQHSGKALAVAPFAAGSPRAGDRVVQVTRNTLDQRQQWQALGQGGDGNGGVVFVYQLRTRIRADNGRLVNGCLDEPNDSLSQANNTALVVRPCDGTRSQKWVRTFSADPTSGTVKTVNLFTGMQWAILNASQAEQAPLIQFRQDGGASHRFTVLGVASLP